MKLSFTSQAALAAALFVILSAVGCSDSNLPRIGVAFYSVDDAFIATARRAFDAEIGTKARLQIVDGQNKERVQAAQVEAMVADKANVIIMNPVERTSSALTRALLAKSAGIPLIFFGREPPPMTVRSWSKLYYVGVHTDEATGVQAEILRDYCEATVGADVGGDGVIHYVILRGESNAIDIDARDSYRDRALSGSSLKFEKIAEATANWSRAEAQKRMTEIIAEQGDKIEAVFCDNDEMALGAIAALRIAGYLKGSSRYIPVLGIDATPFGLEAVKEGSLLGTVRSDAEVQGKTLARLAYDVATGKDLSEWSLQDGQYLYFPYQKVTSDNVYDFTR
jgi:methyl-galactoside transport system substrate-binding protein